MVTIKTEDIGPKQQLDELQSRINQRYQQMCLRRDGWRGIYFLLSKYLLMRPIWFGDTGVPSRTPKISVKDVHDDSAVASVRTCATALGGALWPSTAESFDLAAHMPAALAMDDDELLESQEVRDYFDRITKRVRRAIDSPESGFQTAFGQHLPDQVVYGTSGILGEEREDDDDCPFRFRVASIETCVIDEGADQLVDTVYFEFLYTARQVVDKYGRDKVSQRVKDLFTSGKLDEWVKVIQAVEPRMNVDPSADKSEKKNKPYASIHMEWDTKHILKEDGMDERPVFITRFAQRPNEILGRSLGMEALPTIKELNVLRKGYSKALDKKLDPPIGFYSDAVAGGGEANISAGAKVAYYDTGRIPEGRKPIEILYDIPEPQTATQRLEQLVELIDVKFLIDRLLDFNNKTRMTAKESEMRMDFRNQALTDIFNRQIIELLNPLIKWAVNIMWKRKLLGLHPVKDAVQIQNMQKRGLKPLVIPQAVVDIMQKGKLPFTVRFISPAARAMQAEGMLGLEKLTNFVMTYVNAGVHDVLDNIDTDEAVREYQRLCGAPLRVILGKNKVKKNRDTRNKQMQAQAQAQSDEQQASTLDKKSKAAKNFVQAGLPQLAQGGQQLGAA